MNQTLEITYLNKNLSFKENHCFQSRGKSVISMMTERKCNEYYFFSLKPFVHYIPIKSNFEDLLEKIDWAENNQEKCKEIAKNAQYFALTNLRRRNAVEKYKKILLNLGS